MSEKSSITGLTPEDWAKAAELIQADQQQKVPAKPGEDHPDTIDKTPETVKISPAELQKKYEAFLATHPDLSKAELKVTVGEERKVGSCIQRHFEFGLGRTLALIGDAKFCSTSPSNWSLKIHICLYLLGDAVYCVDVTATPKKIEFCFSKNYVIVKSNYCCGITTEGHRHRFYVRGEFCNFSFTGWHCQKFNNTLFYFG